MTIATHRLTHDDEHSEALDYDRLEQPWRDWARIARNFAYAMDDQWDREDLMHNIIVRVAEVAEEYRRQGRSLSKWGAIKVAEYTRLRFYRDKKRWKRVYSVSLNSVIQDEDGNETALIKENWRNLSGYDWKLIRRFRAGFMTWIDRGNLVVKLRVEQDSRFPLFMDRLKIRFPEFGYYEQLRESVTDFFRMCYAVAHEIWSRTENETGLNLSDIPVMGKGHLVNVPKFIYEFALDNYSSGNQPELEVLQDSYGYYRLVPKDVPNYILARGSPDEMELCKKITICRANEYAADERIGEIRGTAVGIVKQAAPFLAALSTIIREATRDG